ncbi:sulfatase-like hydrolase/transferase [Altererythrobacter sp. ZODW24]|uniref:sulfatase-like hydrolase/transferase n=1 Tax=Altererythrobacter sp. ZODW24 TaxID=2185142 RepID=UPI0013B397F5|nr:sulfatase-like hydrolase/transferase [Altererythrobacter sp. ZODW24]
MNLVKPLLLGGAFVLSAASVTERLTSIESTGGKAIYLILLAMCWIGVIGAAYIWNSMFRWIWAIVLPLAGGMMGVFTAASQQFMTYDAFVNMVHSAGFIGDAWVQNRSAFFAILPATLLMMFGIGLRPRQRLPRFRPVLCVAPLGVLVVLTGLLFMRGGDGGRGLPGGFVVSAYGLLLGYENVTGETGQRKDVLFAPETKPQHRNIVLLVDESIAPAYLDINSPVGVNTPLSKAHDELAIHNFGVAAAVTGCSVGTNVTLRHGGTRDAYQRYNATYPSVWAYAHAAGMRTVYLDGQRSGGAMQNMMDDAERALIDEFNQFGDVPVVDRDMAIAKELVRLMADPEPKFILANKVGAHFPVHDKYPDSHAEYSPALPRGRYSDITDTGDRDGFDGEPDDWRRYRNAYRNTLRWNVGAFFGQLLGEGDFSDTLLLYTADHGQILHEDGSPGLTTHCSPQPPMQEGAVPLLAITGGEGGEWARWADENHDKSSHYMLFPTLLRAMGYPSGEVTATYGNSLTMPSTDPMTFNTLFNARLNRKPEWKRVEPGELPQPPALD